MKKNSMWKMAMSLMIVLAAICFAGCADKEDEEQTYYVEIGRIARTDYNSLLSQYSNITSPTYTQLKQARATLRQYYQYDFASNTGFKNNELYTFFIQHGSTPSEANSSLNNLDSRGNSLGFYNYAYSENYVCWAYAEKE